MKIRGYKGYFTPNSLMGMLKGRVDTSQPLGFFGIIQNLLNYYAHTGITDEKKEEMALQDEYLDENRQQEYDLKEQWYNAHESMPAKKAEYEEAGLNPMLLAGQGSVSASNAPSGQAPSASGTSADPITAISSLLGVVAKVRESNSISDLNKARARRENIVADWEERNQSAAYNESIARTDNLRANLPKIVADSKVAEAYALYAPQLFDSQVAQNNANVQKALADADKARADVKLDEAQIRELDEKCKNHQKERQQMDALIEKIQQECITLSTQAYLNDQLVQESMARVEKYKKQIEEIGVNMGLTQKEIDYYSWNHAHNVSTKNPIATIYKEIYPTDNLPGTPRAGE